MAHSNNPYRSGRVVVHSSSTPQWTVLFVKVLFILLLLLLLPKLVDGSKMTKKKKTKQLLQVIRRHCREQICFYSESMNCVNFCASPACYESVYGDMPLEDGEIDMVRERIYEECRKKQQLETTRRKRVW